MDKIKDAFPCSTRDYSGALEKIVDPDYLYIRKPEIDNAFVAFLKSIKSNYRDVKVLLEIPTYPYKSEIEGKLRFWGTRVKDCRNSNRLFSYVDRIVTYSLDDSIFGIPTINIINGCSVSTVPVRSLTKSNSIRLICVATFAYWHGYERLIDGLAAYYREGGERDFIVHMVGGGQEAEKYKEAVNRCSLGDRFIFHGPLFGDDLNRVFDMADIAVDSLGWYKKKVQSGSPIKTAEYLARGLPVILGFDLTYINKLQNEYYLKVPNNESAVNMEEVADFYDSISEMGFLKARDEIRNNAEQVVDISSAFTPIKDYLLS